MQHRTVKGTNIAEAINAATKPAPQRIIFPDGTIKYCVIGTNYGYIHTTAGEMKFWKSYRGAYKAAKRYIGT